jgi:methionyl-tRNA formyltransferase
MSAADRLPSVPAAAGPRILYFGMAGRFSALPLATLLAAGLPVVGVVLPAPARPGSAPIEPREPPLPARRTLALVGPAAAPALLDLAWQHGIPACAVNRLRHPATLATLAGRRPDLIVVACFPRRLPPALLALAPLGGVNLHPSLLPAGRGPAPRFWAFRHGLARSGVTVHRLTDALDAGPILAQAAFDLPDGMTGDEFDARAATLGGHLLVDTARALAAGAAWATPQDEHRASYDPWPSAADYLITPDRPARWVYNFVRGVAGDGGPLTLRLGDERLAISEALAFAAEGELGAPARRAGQTLWVQCRPGVVHLQLAASSDRPGRA